MSSPAWSSRAAPPGLDAGRSYDVVDFKELETAERRLIVLRVRANAAYRLTLTSENAGALVLEDARAGPYADRVTVYVEPVR